MISDYILFLLALAAAIIAAALAALAALGALLFGKPRNPHDHAADKREFDRLRRGKE